MRLILDAIATVRREVRDLREDVAEFDPIPASLTALLARIGVAVTKAGGK